MKKIITLCSCLMVILILTSWKIKIPKPKDIIKIAVNPLGPLGPLGPIGGVAGGALGGVIGGVAGGAISDAAGPAIDRFGERTDQSINKANAALEDRLKQFEKILSSETSRLDTLVSTQLKNVDKIITTQLGAVNSILDVQQVKLQQSISEAIGDADNRIEEAINNVDEITELRIGQFNTGLTFTSYYLTLSLWQIIVGFAQLILVILLIFFILRSVSTFIPRGINQSEVQQIISRSKIYGAITLAGFILISIYNPIKSKALNRGYGKIINSYEQDLNLAAQIYDYRKAAYDAYILSELDKSENIYDYYKIKYELLKDLAYRPKLALFNEANLDNINNKLNQLKITYEKTSIKDPEYYIVIAIYYINALRNREGDIIAYYLCNKALIKRNESEPIGNKPLDILAASIIKNQTTHPYSDQEITRVIKMYSIDEEVPNPNKLDRVEIADSLLNRVSVFSANLLYNNILRDVVKADEKDFISFLDAEITGDDSKLKTIGNNMVNRWTQLTFNIKNIKNSQVKLASTDLNDSYVQYIINTLIKKNFLMTEYSLINEESNNIIITTFNGEDSEKSKAIKLCSDSLTAFKKYIVSDMLQLFSIRPKIALSQLEVNKSRNMYSLVNNFAKNYKTYRLDKSNRESLRIAIDICAVQGIYDRRTTLLKPLYLVLLDEYKQTPTPSEKNSLSDFSNLLDRKFQFSRLNFL